MRLFYACLFWLLPGIFWAQNTVSGVVRDAADNSPLPGVTIRPAGPGGGTLSDGEGKFTVAAATGDTLLFQFVGYAEQRIVVGGRSSIEVYLSEAAGQLGEVVVTAFGIERQKRELGYATQNVKGEDLLKSNTAGLATSLSGRMAGVNIVQGNGVEGGTTRIVIRGNNLITGDNQPLIVVDGVILENEPGFTSLEVGRDWGSALNNINPADVERIDVLKGANAAALYGVRGGNGVILITTKKGVARPGIGVEVRSSLRTVQPFYWRELQNEYGFGAPFSFDVPRLEVGLDGIPLHPTELYTDFGPEGKPTTETFGAYSSAQSWGARLDGQMIRWWDGEMRPWAPQPDNFERFFQTGFNQLHNLAFSGGGKNGTLRASFTREDNRSVALNSEYDQTTANIGSRLNLTEGLRTEIALSYLQYNRKNSPLLGSDNNSFGKIMAYGYPRSYQGENLPYENPDGTKRDFGVNPFAWGNIDVFWPTYNNNTWLRRNKVIGSVGVFYEPVSWLTLMGRLGADNTFDEFETRNKPTDLSGTLGGGYAHSLGRETVFNNEFLATFKRPFLRERLFASLSLGGSQYRRRSYTLLGENFNEWRDPFLYTLNNVESGRPTLGESRYERRLNSLYGFVNLGWKTWLFGQVTLRNDWSSTLSRANNSYRFPSFNLSFVPTEAFAWENRHLTHAKIRGAFSETALDGAPYQLETVYYTGIFGNQSTAFTENKVRPLNLFPQRTRSWEIGADLGFWNDRLTLDATWYYVRAYNQLLDAPVPVSSGYEQVRINSGVVSNRGIELILSAHILSAKNLSWRTGINFAQNRNRLDELADGAQTLNLGSIWGDNGPGISVQAGQPYGIITGFDYVRHEATGKPIVSEDGTRFLITDVRVPIKIYDDNGQFLRYANSTPRFTGGWTNTLTFRNFTLFTLIDAKVGGDMWAGSYALGLQAGTSPETLAERNGGGLEWTDAHGVVRHDGVLLDGVYADGTPNDKVVHYYYKYLNAGGWGRVATTPAVLENTWIKLREVSLSWAWTPGGTRKFFQRLDVTLTGRDLAYLFSSLPDRVNPEGANGSGNAQGIEFGALPGMRSFGVSVGAQF